MCKNHHQLLDAGNTVHCIFLNIIINVLRHVTIKCHSECFDQEYWIFACHSWNMVPIFQDVFIYVLRWRRHLTTCMVDRSSTVTSSPRTFWSGRLSDLTRTASCRRSWSWRTMESVERCCRQARRALAARCRSWRLRLFSTTEKSHTPRRLWSHHCSCSCCCISSFSALMLLIGPISISIDQR